MNGGDSASVLLVILVSLGMGLIIFLISREILCWYVRTNEIKSKLDEIEGMLRGIKNLLRNNASIGPNADKQDDQTTSGKQSLGQAGR